ASWNTSQDQVTGLPDGGAVSQSTGIIKMEFIYAISGFQEVAAWPTPQSSSWTNMNWQKFNYRFIYRAADNINSLVFTNGTNQGISIDAVTLSKVDCTPREECTAANIDDDGDGLNDCDDPDCYGLGQAQSVVTTVGVDNASAALYAPDGEYAQIYGTNDRLVLDLGTTLVTGTEYTIIWKRNSDYTDDFAADMRVEESIDATNFDFNSVNPSTTEKNFSVATRMITQRPTRFLRLRQVSNAGDDLDVDAVLYAIDCPTCDDRGEVYYERFNGVQGSSISNLTSNNRYPDSPQSVGTLPSFDFPNNSGDNFGIRVRGYLHPVESGNYTFITTADQVSEVYLSTDHTEGNATRIAFNTTPTGETEFNSAVAQTSAAISLQAGQRYYIEYLGAERSGSDHFQLYWQTPSNNTPTIIAGEYLSPFTCDFEICDDGEDNDGDGRIDCDDADAWNCCGFDEWNYDCDDGTCIEIVGTGIKNDINQTLNFTDPSTIRRIVIESTFDGGSGHPDQVTFTNAAGIDHTVDKIPFDTGNDFYFRAYFNGTSSITLSTPNGTNAARGETFIAYVFRECENTASAGAFTHKFLLRNSHTFSFDIPTSNFVRDIEIIVPLSEITNDTRIAEITATAGSVSETITINSYNQGNSLNITPFTLNNVPGSVGTITVEVSSPTTNGQSLYLSGAGGVNVVCPQFGLDVRVDKPCATVGETVNYTYAIVNGGATRINQLTLNDSRFGPLNTPNSLDAGDSVIINRTYVVQPNNLPGPIFNSATVSGRPPGGSTMTDTDAVSVDLHDVSFTKTVDQTSAKTGDVINYTYEVTNNGSATAYLSIDDDKLGNVGGNDTRITDNLVNLYDFSENSGSVIRDRSANDTPIDLTIELPANTTWNDGQLSVDTETRAASNGNESSLFSSFAGRNEITVEAWVRPSNTTQGGPSRIYSFSEDLSSRNFQLVQDGTNYGFRLRTTDDDNAEVYTTGNQVSTAAWQHVVYTYDGSSARMYLNGNSVNISGDTNPTGDFSNWSSNYKVSLFNENNSPSGQREWLGEMDMVATYNRALSASEITQNFNAGASVSTLTLQAGATETLIVPHRVDVNDLP
ncbi:MAG: LamG-like jellyroll fold domain-containing protein, partial [Saprospiraceae bacterium]